MKKQQQIEMPTFVSVSEEILDDRNGCNTQKKSIGNKYNLVENKQRKICEK